MNEYIAIRMTKDCETTVDVIDADLNNYNWTADTTHNGVVYAYRRANNQSIRMHRVICSRMIERELKSNEHVDHIDGNGLNNCRSNLRLCTPSQNQHNQRKHNNNTSGYKGVYFHKRTGKWMVRIAINKKRHFLGEFESPELAYTAYCDAAKKYHGEFARLE